MNLERSTQTQIWPRRNEFHCLTYAKKSDCLRMAREFPDVTSQLTVRLVEGATHAFDWPNPPPPAHSPFAKAQTGGVVTMKYSANEAETARAEMVQFFLSRLKQTGNE